MFCDEMYHGVGTYHFKNGSVYEGIGNYTAFSDTLYYSINVGRCRELVQGNNVWARTLEISRRLVL